MLIFQTFFRQKCRQKYRIGTSFFLNITTFINNIIIKKGINYLLSDVKSTTKSVHYLQPQNVNNRQHSLKLLLKFQYGTISKMSSPLLQLTELLCLFTEVLFFHGQCPILQKSWAWQWNQSLIRFVHINNLNTATRLTSGTSKAPLDGFYY